LIRERTKAGLTAAAARGRKGGRKPVVTAEKLQRAREYIANGLTVREAAARIKVGKTALYAALKASETTPTLPIDPAPETWHNNANASSPQTSAHAHPDELCRTRVHLQEEADPT
jgi:hypothetical protein